MISKPYSIFILILGLAGGIAFLTLSAFAETQAVVPHSVPHKVVAYYFHTNTRCSTCKKIEEYSHEAIEKGFPNELRTGTLELRVVNYELPEDRHFMQDYQLVTKSLVLVEVADGKQLRWANLKRVWQLTGRKDDFVNYVRNEVRGYLAKE